MADANTLKLALHQVIEKLDEEETLLRSGNFDEFAKAIDEKEKLWRHLNHQIASTTDGAALKHVADHIVHLKTRASQHQRLLDNYRRGVTSAQNRIKNVQQRETDIGVYAKDGAKMHYTKSGSTKNQTA